jgi:hypothetical protein
LTNSPTSCVPPPSSLEEANGYIWESGGGVGGVAAVARCGQAIRDAQAVTTVQESLGYLAKRRAMLTHTRCDARGYSIGSGSVESSNKLVVERRMKRAGMHWARRCVYPVVALRAPACSDRWQEAWPQMAQYVRHQTQQKRQQRQRARRPAKARMLLVLLQATPPLVLAPAPTESRRRSPSSKLTVHQASKGPYRPPPDHPWRRFRIRWRGLSRPIMSPAQDADVHPISVRTYPSRLV